MVAFFVAADLSFMGAVVTCCVLGGVSCRVLGGVTCAGWVSCHVLGGCRVVYWVVPISEIG